MKIARGVMTTDDLRLAGPAARVDITGEADLAKETQSLNVRVLPALSTTFSAGTAGARCCCSLRIRWSPRRSAPARCSPRR